VNAYKVETVVNEDGSLTLKGLPFQAGDRVEVIVLEQSNAQLKVQAHVQFDSSERVYLDGLTSLMSEWESEADEVAYCDL
jgi:hypothetical protein